MKPAFLLILAVIVPAFLMAEDLKTEITGLLKEQDAAWNRGDLDGFLSYYDNSNELVFVSSTEVRSLQELKARYEKRYGNGQADFGKLTFSELRVEELAPGLVRSWGRWLVENKGQKSSGWFTLILKKKENGWRIIHDHSSSDE